MERAAPTPAREALDAAKKALAEARRWAAGDKSLAGRMVVALIDEATAHLIGVTADAPTGPGVEEIARAWTAEFKRYVCIHGDLFSKVFDVETFALEFQGKYEACEAWVQYRAAKAVLALSTRPAPVPEVDTPADVQTGSVDRIARALRLVLDVLWASGAAAGEGWAPLRAASALLEGEPGEKPLGKGPQS